MGVSASEGPGVALPRVGRGHPEGLQGLEARLAAQARLASRVSNRADRNTTFLTQGLRVVGAAKPLNWGVKSELKGQRKIKMQGPPCWSSG